MVVVHPNPNLVVPFQGDWRAQPCPGGCWAPKEESEPAQPSGSSQHEWGEGVLVSYDCHNEVPQTRGGSQFWRRESEIKVPARLVS